MQKNIAQIRVHKRRPIHYCGHFSGSLLRSRERMKISVWKVLLSSCGEIEPSSILPANFLKRPISTKKTKLLAVTLKILSSRIQKKYRQSQRKKRMHHNYQAKML